MDPNDQKKTACYDIDVEVDDTLKTQMNSFLLSTASQQEIAGLDNKVCMELMVEGSSEGYSDFQGTESNLQLMVSYSEAV